MARTAVKKKILYLRTDISSQELKAGGSVAHTLGVINGFRELGYEVVCASSIMLELLRKIEGLELIKLVNPHLLKFLRWRLNCLLSTLFFAIQLRPLFRKHVFDVIYQRYSLLNATGIVVSKLTGISLMLEYNGSELWIDQHWVRRQWFKLRWLVRIIENLNVRYAYTIVVVSDVLKAELVGRGISPEKIIVNPNGVDCNRYNPAILVNERQLLRKQLALEQKVVFGFIGTFSQWHGIEVLACLIPEIIKERAQAHFLLIGDGPLRSWLQSIVYDAGLERAVTFTGLIPQEQAPHYLAACDAFLSPTQPNPDGTRFFGSPTKLFEYMSMAKPIIASDLEQLAEVITPALGTSEDPYDAVGFLVYPTDVERFKKAMLMVIDWHEEQRAALGYHARQRAVTHYSWREHVHRIIRYVER
jgi:glycosyltransferase involved in cell wall biosynthesis